MRNRLFRETYVAARNAFISGVRDALFPFGTYWLRRFAGVACAHAAYS